MSNKTQLQTNNTKLSELITTLQGKAVGGDGSETTTVTAGEWVRLSSLPTTYAATPDEENITVYLGLESNVTAVIFVHILASRIYYNNCFCTYWKRKVSSGQIQGVFTNTDTINSCTIADVSTSEDKILQITGDSFLLESMYALPIYEF